jgi:hypothetical protein
MVPPPARINRASRLSKPAASTVLFCSVLVAGLVLRLLALRSSLAQQNSDTSIVYLMARHVARGDLRVFYWGKPMAARCCN